MRGKGIRGVRQVCVDGCDGDVSLACERVFELDGTMSLTYLSTSIIAGFLLARLYPS